MTELPTIFIPTINSQDFGVLVSVNVTQGNSGQVRQLLCLCCLTYINIKGSRVLITLNPVMERLTTSDILGINFVVTWLISQEDLITEKS